MPIFDMHGTQVDLSDEERAKRNSADYGKRPGDIKINPTAGQAQTVPNPMNTPARPPLRDISTPVAKSQWSPQETQANLAMDFRKNIAGKSGAYSNVLTGQLKSQIADQIGNIKSRANARGLLNSGIQKGAERSAERQAAAAYVPQMSEYNKQLQEQADAMERASIDQGLNDYSLRLGVADQTWKDALAQRQQQIDNMNAVPNAIGNVFSGLAGGNAARGGGQQGGPMWVDQGYYYDKQTGRTERDR